MHGHRNAGPPPRPDAWWLLIFLFTLNRIISGVAEAAVSGADEALFQKLLKEAGREKNGRCFGKTQIRFLAFSLPDDRFRFLRLFFRNHYLSYLVDYAFAVEPGEGPSFLTFLSSIVVLIAALGMKEMVLIPKVDRSRKQWKIFQTTLSRLLGLEHLSIQDSSGFYDARQCNSSVSHHCQRMLECVDLPLHFWTLIPPRMSLMGYFVPRIAETHDDDSFLKLLSSLLYSDDWTAESFETLPY